MFTVLILGCGKIGSLIAHLLAHCEDYRVLLVDKDFDNSDARRLLENQPPLTHQTIDVTDEHQLSKLIKKEKVKAIISSLPFFLNKTIIPLAKMHQCHYFDLTEDVDTADFVASTAEGVETAFVPQCGLAPGFISIGAHHIMSQFEICHSVHCRVGALPQHVNNALKYALTWSTDGLINIYANPCPAIEHGNATTLEPLEGYETLQLDGLSYEAFNTSGGLGALATSCLGKVDQLNYKTIRYPGHWKTMRLLLHDLKLKNDRPLLKTILENALTHTYDDVVLVYLAVTGLCDDRKLEKTFFKKYYPKTVHGLKWSAIQLTTATSVCAVVDCVLTEPAHYSGIISQTRFDLSTLQTNRFGHYYA